MLMVSLEYGIMHDMILIFLAYIMHVCSFRVCLVRVISWNIMGPSRPHRLFSRLVQSRNENPSL